MTAAKKKPEEKVVKLPEKTEEPVDLEGKNIMQRINLVRKAVRRIEQKDNATIYTEGGKSYEYSFASTEDIIDGLHDKCVEYGVMIIPDTHTSNITKSGKVTHATVELLMNFINEDDIDDRFTTKFDGEAFDFSDKALRKAYTSAYREGLKRTFMLSTGEIDIERQDIIPEDATPLTLDQVTEIEDRMESVGVTKAQRNQLYNYYNVKALSDIPLPKYEAVLSWIKKIEQSKKD
jgi:hypothetical protein